MKKLAPVLLFIAMTLFFASSTLGAYHFIKAGEPDVNFVHDLVVMLATGIVALFALFLRSRVNAGGRIFELTTKDKVELQELRRDFGLRNILAGLFVRLGGLLIVTAVLSPVLWRFEWLAFAGLLATGIVLVFLALLLERSIKR